VYEIDVLLHNWKILISMGYLGSGFIKGCCWFIWLMLQNIGCLTNLVEKLIWDWFSCVFLDDCNYYWCTMIGLILLWLAKLMEN